MKNVGLNLCPLAITGPIAPVLLPPGANPMVWNPPSVPNLDSKIPLVAVMVKVTKLWLVGSGLPPFMPNVVDVSRLCPTVIGVTEKDMGTTVAASVAPQFGVLNAAGVVTARVVVPG